MIEKDALSRLISEGLTTVQIAKVLGCSQSTVLRSTHRLGLPMPFRHPPSGRPKRLSLEQEAAYNVRQVSLHRKRLKAKSIAYKGGKCQLCGYSACNNALEFHHLDKKAKEFGLSKGG